jgi:DNA adenine methylase
MKNEIRSDIVDGISDLDGGYSNLIPFSYLGGKYKHLNWILPNLPHKKCYIEPFGGSGVVLLNRKQSDLETFNDKYSEVTNFFRVLRNKPDELLQKISLTPYSEQEFKDCLENRDSMSDIEKARTFFLIVNMSYDKNLDSPNWSYSVNFSSSGVSKKISSYKAKIKRLKPIAKRLTDVQITNRDAIDVIQTFDTEQGLIYCDPPYPPEVREFEDAYGVEMKDEKHREMAEVLQSSEADIAISSYENDLYNDLFSGWNRIDAEEKSLSSSPGEGKSTTRTECLYVNYGSDFDNTSEVNERSVFDY